MHSIYKITCIHSRVVKLLCLSLALTPNSFAACYQAPASRINDRSAQVTLNVNTIFKKTLEESRSILPNGTRVSHPAVPSAPALAEMQRIGAAGVPALNEHLWSTDDFESGLAMRFLSAIGGNQAMAALCKLAREHPRPARRRKAILWLAPVSSEQVRAALQDIATHDPSPEVRQAASKALSSSSSP